MHIVRPLKSCPVRARLLTADMNELGFFFDVIDGLLYWEERLLPTDPVKFQQLINRNEIPYCSYQVGRFYFVDILTKRGLLVARYSLDGGTNNPYSALPRENLKYRHICPKDDAKSKKLKARIREQRKGDNGGYTPVGLLALIK